MRAEYIDHMGDDISVVNAARVSFDKTSDWEWGPYCDQCGDSHGPYLPEADKKLIQYLAKHDHWTPFAHTSISLRMSAPVPIRTQCFKHKQGFVENEESRRYISSRPELFIPEYFRQRPTGSIKQGSGEEHPASGAWKNIYHRVCDEAIGYYETMINDGVCPEQARFILPQGVMVNWIWTGNLYSFANFYNKRTDANAQKEIQELAILCKNIIEPFFPVSWLALTEKE